jgi:hypothetical protein
MHRAWLTGTWLRGGVFREATTRLIHGLVVRIEQGDHKHHDGCTDQRVIARALTTLALRRAEE